MKDFEDKDEEDDSIAVIDPDAESEEDLEDSYIGKVILDCSVCHTDIYKDKEDITIDEEAGLANIGEECPYCYSSEGFKVIGEVKPFVETTFETDDDVDVEVDDEEVDNEDMNESFEDNKQEVIGIGWSRQSIPEFRNWLKQHPSHRIWKDGNRYLLGRGVNDSYAMAISVSDINKLRKDKFFASKIEEVENESLKRKRIRESISKMHKKALVEKPVYGLEPRYDARKSFYGKAQVDTGDKGDKNRLYSYDTLVAEIKDGKPVVYGTYSATTLRHIKDWLKQNGFRADTSKQIMADYGVKDEACNGKKSIKESSGEVFHNDNGLDYTVVERSKSGKNALLNRGKQWIIAWNCPQDNNGSWGQGHYFFDESEAREWWNKKYIKESKSPMKISKKPIKESCSINQCQKWVDYDMKKYKKISDDTMEKIKSSGYSVVKDQYGDYEVIADRKDESLKESIEDIDFNDFFWEVDPKGKYENNMSKEVFDTFVKAFMKKFNVSKKTAERQIYKKFLWDFDKSELKESIEDITIDTGDQEISVSARDKERKSDGEMIAPLSDEVKADIEMDSDDIDVDVDEFSEEDFDELGESYLKKVYENVDSYRTTSVKTKGNKLFVEGLIKFNSGKEKKTSFVFESRTITKSGKAKLIGENLQISRGHKSFKLTGTINNGKFISESLNYNYRVKNGSESQRVYGTAKKSK